ncbi:hypothetical protein SAMN05519103_03250 [Rhizobiales bacterium GAS113]|nr:hypothetical protein SAMN05519103_03250 [Rhizobiales bacterium GAS113]
MAFRTEVTLDELLAEPMVKLLMRKDGVSIGEARALYDRVRPWLTLAQQERSGAVASPCIAPWAVCRPDQISPCP